jgi:glycolate oxidase iron-sulfur subunit
MKPTDLPADLSSSSEHSVERADINSEASRCVACGLCLPHCPTYRLTLSEADSPRGRIALIGGATTGRIPINERFALHMDRCLTCRACESVCPNQVRFGPLMDAARTMLESPRNGFPGEQARRRSGMRKWIEREFIARPARLDALRPLLRLYQNSGLQKWLRRSRLLHGTRLAALENQLPFIDKPPASSGPLNGGKWREIYPASMRSTQPRREIGLFLGCVARLTDVATLNAAIFVLNRLGYTVHVPDTQTCCGALHQHSGDRITSEKLALENVAAFNGLNLEAILSTASGCGVQLAEYGLSPFSQTSSLRSHAGDDGTGSLPPGGPVLKKLSAKVMDISAFLAAAEGWDEVTLAPLPHKIAVHEPCTLRNVLRGSNHVYSLLARIPGAMVTPLAGNDQCCGAAGTYFIDQPEMAAALLDAKMSAIKASGARYLATSNVGCAMQMGAALRETGSEIEVVHPVMLIARQMGIQL